MEDYNVGPKGEIRRGPVILDPRGYRINLTDRQKNAFYADAKKQKEEIKEKLCTRDECRNPTEHNVRKMIGSEFEIKQKIIGFKKRMQAIGADPKEYNVEKFRR